MIYLAKIIINLLVEIENFRKSFLWFRNNALFNHKTSIRFNWKYFFLTITLIDNNFFEKYISHEKLK